MQFLFILLLNVRSLQNLNLHFTNCEVRERKPTRCNNQMFIINFCINIFRASLCPSSGEPRRVLLHVVCSAGSAVVGGGCGALRCRVRALWRLLFDSAPHNAAPHNRHQPQQNQRCTPHAVKHVLVLLKMGIMMPEIC